MEEKLDSLNHKGIGFLILSAYGITKEPVASNRITGLIRGLKSIDTGLVALEFPEQTPSELRSITDVFIVRNSYFQKTFRKLLNLRKKRNTEVRTENISGVKQTAVKQKFKKIVRTLMHIWYAEGYPFPFFRFTLESIFAARKKLKENDMLVVFASNGPASVGLSGIVVKRFFRKKVFLVQDFRDPIARNVYLKDQANTRFLEFVEKIIISSADLVTVVSRGVIESLTGLPENAYVLYNGFEKSAGARKNDEIIKGSIGYFGSVYADRLISLSFLARAIKDTDYCFYYAGKNSDDVYDIFKRISAEENLKLLGFLSKDDVLEFTYRMQVLLILKAAEDRGVLTGKLFEYLQTERPVLVIGNSDYEFNEIVKNFGGVFVVPPDERSIKEAIAKISKPDFQAVRNWEEIDKFSWNNLAENFMRKLTELIGTHRETLR
jgi:glycosyltransferase involved in cell wall biosynthesis